MNDLNALTVDLFLYDLCEGLGRSRENAEAVKQRFWQRLYPDANGNKPENIRETDAYFADYVELLDGKRYEVFSDDSIDGYYYPVQLGDTYALQVDSSGDKAQAQQAAAPHTVKTISADILENRIRHQHGELGESWLVWGQLSSPHQDAEATAKACYSALANAQTPGQTLSWQRNYAGKGSFDGAVVYELQQLDTFLDGKNSNHHVLIFLFPAGRAESEVEATMSKLNRHLIRLFHNRSKVLWLYEESRKLKGNLKEASDAADPLVAQLSRHVQSPCLNLKLLQQHLADALRTAHIYENQLNYLREKEPEISTNLTSYCKRTATMADIDASADLAFLGDLVTLTKEKYIGQIRADVAAFEGARKPLSASIQTVQGIIDIERTQNERVLNRTVAIAGVGISAASLAASSIGDRADSLVQAWRPAPAEQPAPVANLLLSATLILTVSLAVGILAAWITALLINQKANRP